MVVKAYKMPVLEVVWILRYFQKIRKTNVCIHLVKFCVKLVGVHLVIKFYVPLKITLTECIHKGKYCFFISRTWYVIYVIHCFSTNVLSTKTEKILSRMNDLHPDPNDPNNVSFFEALKVWKIQFSNLVFFQPYWM